MLQGKDGCGYKDRNLLTVTNSLESGPDGYFRLSEANISTYEPVHGAGILHVMFDGYRSQFLIRSILIHEGRFKFLLQIRIGRECETLGRLALCIQLYKILGYVLYPGLGI